MSISPLPLPDEGPMLMPRVELIVVLWVTRSVPPLIWSLKAVAVAGAALETASLAMLRVPARMLVVPGSCC